MDLYRPSYPHIIQRLVNLYWHSYPHITQRLTNLFWPSYLHITQRPVNLYWHSYLHITQRPVNLYWHSYLHITQRPVNLYWHSYHPKASESVLTQLSPYHPKASESVLTQLSPYHPLPGIILEYRQVRYTVIPISPKGWRPSHISSTERTCMILSSLLIRWRNVTWRLLIWMIAMEIKGMRVNAGKTMVLWYWLGPPTATELSWVSMQWLQKTRCIRNAAGYVWHQILIICVEGKSPPIDGRSQREVQVQQH